MILRIMKLQLIIDSCLVGMQLIADISLVEIAAGWLSYL